MNYESTSDESDSVEGHIDDESNSGEGHMNYESMSDDSNPAEGHMNYETMSYKINPVEGQTNYESMSYEINSVEGRVPAVVGDEYVVHKKFVLHTSKKKWGYSWSGDFSVEDQNKNRVFRAHRSSGLSKTILLRDTNDLPVLCLHKKALFSFGNWKIYTGSEPRHDALLFKWKTHRSKNKIYLSANVLQEYPDFTINMRWYGRSFKVFYQNKVIAEARQQRFRFGRRKIFISAVPHVDQAFIAAILVLMEEQFEEATRTNNAGAAGGNLAGAFAPGGGGA